MKTIQFFFAICLITVSFAATAQTAQLANNTEDLVVETNKVGEKTHSGAEIISAYQEGIAITKQFNKFGLVNQQGYEIVTARFEAIHAFQNGYAAAQLHGKWSFINKQGKKIAAFRYQWVGSFQNGFAPVKINGKWTFINEQGAELSEAQFDAVRSFDNGTALVRMGENWLQIDAFGKISSLKNTVSSKNNKEI